ncbi:hypothetical protein FA95DRAFT_1500072 [Auriscalpium vulgare]|uniref:Uncharacterized protein n=1 Tax=Auriscalpium vulgare TaxID=40419 RepID=A0ACB8REL6_9AGAM|nr:hypothetical protein FA95DRAFT_1500072 [Auriscalpium vulgare]
MLDLGDLDYLEALINSKPSFFLDKLQKKLATVQQVHASLPTITCMLHSLALNHKRVLRALT